MKLISKFGTFTYQLSRVIRRARLGTPRTATVKRGNQERLALYLGDTTDPLSEENRKRIKTIRGMKVGNTLPFARAGFEEMTK